MAFPVAVGDRGWYHSVRRHSRFDRPEQNVDDELFCRNVIYRGSNTKCNLIAAVDWLILSSGIDCYTHGSH